jgi:hypothetical protein
MVELTRLSECQERKMEEVICYMIAWTDGAAISLFMACTSYFQLIGYFIPKETQLCFRHFYFRSSVQ